MEIRFWCRWYGNNIVAGRAVCRTPHAGFHDSIECSANSIFNYEVTTNILLQPPPPELYQTDHYMALSNKLVS